jgi:hypothetical protein
LTGFTGRGSLVESGRQQGCGESFAMTRRKREYSLYVGKPDEVVTAILITGYVLAATLIATMGIATYVRLG